MIGYQLHCQIHFLPKTRNELERRHWSVIHKEKQHCYEMVLSQVARNRPVSPLKKAALVLTRHSTTEPDFDNLVGSWKYILDALKKYRIIEDDKPSVIGSPHFRWCKAKKNEGFIEIKVIECCIDSM